MDWAAVLPARVYKRSFDSLGMMKKNDMEKKYLDLKAAHTLQQAFLQKLQVLPSPREGGSPVQAELIATPRHQPTTPHHTTQHHTTDNPCRMWHRKRNISRPLSASRSLSSDTSNNSSSNMVRTLPMAASPC